MIFDGRAEAKKIEGRLAKSDSVLRGKGLLILSNEPDSIYVRLKKEMGERLGVKVKIQITNHKSQVIEQIEKFSKGFDGVLVQLPIAGADAVETQEILDLIPANKDVDGLNSRSSFRPAVVEAVIKILKIAGVETGRRVCVVGSEGMVGRRLMRDLGECGYSCLGFDQGDDLKGLSVCDTIVSATGVIGLIKPDIVRDGVVMVDLGFPKGDAESAVATKAAFFTPVPGGVGPLTIVSLFENLART